MREDLLILSALCALIAAWRLAARPVPTDPLRRVLDTLPLRVYLGVSVLLVLAAHLGQPHDPTLGFAEALMPVAAQLGETLTLLTLTALSALGSSALRTPRTARLPP